jgi:hypothetical protein
VACGSGFVNENTTVYDNYLRALVAKVKAADPSVAVLIYFHAFISGERGASAKYFLDRVLNYHGKQVFYRSVGDAFCDVCDRSDQTDSQWL